LNLPATLSNLERDRLDRIRQNYLYQSTDGILLEETIKMVLLSPLLELAGFYQSPYKFRAEVSVEIEAIGDLDEILRGRIDALVLQNRLWIVLIEAKKATFDLELALPQTLAYMAANPQPGSLSAGADAPRWRSLAFGITETLRERALFGMITNGSSRKIVGWVALKLNPTYPANTLEMLGFILQPNLREKELSVNQVTSSNRSEQVKNEGLHDRLLSDENASRTLCLKNWLGSPPITQNQLGS
jgi:hypothetical protein